MNSPAAVMHLVDTLAVGGAERMAVNLVNSLPRDRFRPHLCCTRHDGPLASAVDHDVVRLTLDRSHRLDAAALARLVAHVRRHDVRVLHAHSAAVFAAVLASLAPPYPVVVWHDHYGPPLASRTSWPYRVIAGRLAHVVAVNESLAHWARSTLRLPPGRVSYVPNFVARAAPQRPVAGLPGEPGRRVACVANLRPQKDHATLIAAFARVVAAVPDAQLLLVGAESDGDHAAALRRAVEDAGIAHRVGWLGVRDDVPDVLRACAVGVLSSLSEGLPLALLEYGMAGLATVATSVGQCADVLDHGRAGVLVPPSDPAELASALIALLRDPPRRAALGGALRAHVEESYGEASAVATITALYDAILGDATRNDATPIVIPAPAGIHAAGDATREDATSIVIPANAGIHAAGDATREDARVGPGATAFGQRGRVTRKTPNAGRVDGGAAPAPIGDGGLSGVIGRERVPPL